MAQQWIAKILLAFVTLIIGIVLLTSVATQEQTVTSLTVGATEQIDVTASVNATDVTQDVYTLTNVGDSSVDCVIRDYTFENTT